MKISHLLVLGLIAFIVFRLTQSVQDPPPRDSEQRDAGELIETNSAPVRTDSAPVRTETTGSASRKGVDSPIRTILQRLIAPPPAATPTSQVASAPNLSTEPAASPAATPVPLAPRERLRMAQERRSTLVKEYGPPRAYQGRLHQHLEPGTVVVRTREAGEFVLEEYEAEESQSDGAMIAFDAWSAGVRTFTNPDGGKVSVRRLIHASPPLPLWDQYGRPINRDVVPVETVREAGIHTPTMLDRKPR
jgi:hypothetical protein